MPSHKNQHFVPRCALKPFTLNGQGDAINLFNIARSRHIANAPVKGQCARDYLYGKDGRIEKNLAVLEGHYARILVNLSRGSPLTENDREWLRTFVAVQVRRTDFAIQQMRQGMDTMADEVFKNHPEQRPADPYADVDLMMLSMRIAIVHMKHADDLKIAIFRNRTNIDFVTSDNPAMLTNRYHLQNLNQKNFGLANSGALVSMPLTPRLSAILYDKGVYSVGNGSDEIFVDVTRLVDIQAINSLQYLSASKNIYYSAWNDGENIAEGISQAAEERASAKPKATTFVKVRPRGQKERYRIGTATEQAAATTSLVMLGFQHPSPSRWPVQIKIRQKLKTFDNGTAAGQVRKAEWLQSRRT